MMIEALKEGLMFCGVAGFPVWGYIVFCLARGLWEDIRKFLRRRGEGQ